MSITFSCSCGKSVQVGDEFAGQEGRCPSCGKTVRIPDPDGQFTANTPRATETAPWDRPPQVEALPEPEDDLPPLVTHAGTPIREEDEFFADAPVEIGGLYSAYTTLTNTRQPTPTGLRLAYALIAFFIGIAGVGIATFLVLGRLRPGPDLSAPVIAAVVIGALFAVVVYFWTSFHATCSYVGMNGIARYYCSGNRDHISRTELFHFDAATELRSTQTRHYYNGIYTGTDYNFTWTNERGEVVHQLSGRFSSEAGTPAPADAYYYALMAENAWTMHLLRDIDRIISGNELLFFGLKGGDYVELGQSLIILVQRGNTLELHGDQIQKMTIANGVVSIWEIGAKEGWFVNKGIHQFMYHDLGNARFFLFALERLLGIRF